MKLIRRGTFVFAIAAIAVLAFGTTAQASNHANTSPIPISDGVINTSTIAVAGITGTVMDVNVTLKGISHTWPDDIDIWVAGPGGQKVALMSDAGGSTDISGIDLTFDDAGAPLTTGPITGGTYHPTDLATGACPGDHASQSGAGTALAAYNGVNPNGTWTLNVYDDCFFDVGGIAGGWSLAIRACILPEVVALTDPTPAGPVVASLLCT